ncbi:MAG: hypothetical protein DME25_02715 [Verrucomicrobia bacterium]|nr:MAG: hypothetical protein DME25_02715 [Verrucomicrobiota bacterium]
MDVPPTKPGAAAIEMQAVAVSAMRDQSIQVAEGINWTVAAGDYWVVAGLQGAGKSDFLMMTAGLMPPAQGSYRLFGEEMPIFDEARLNHRLRLGLVFDGGQLLNHLTVWENVALPLLYHESFAETEAHKEVQKLLVALELAPWAESTSGTMSRNWQKRVGLARALALRPEVLLVDTPLTGLDLPHVNWWLALLDQLSKGHPLLQGRPVTLVVTAADLRPWKGRAKQFAVLKNRRLAVLGTWEQAEAAKGELLDEVYE